MAVDVDVVVTRRVNPIFLPRRNAQTVVPRKKQSRKTLVHVWGHKGRRMLVSTAMGRARLCFRPVAMGGGLPIRLTGRGKWLFRLLLCFD